MNKMVIMVLAGMSLAVHAMQRVNSKQDFAERAGGEQMYPVDLGQDTPHELKLPGSQVDRGMVTANDGKRYSVALSLDNLERGIELGITNDQLCRQMAKDVLKILYEENEEYKKFKHARGHLERAIKAHFNSPRSNPRDVVLAEQLDCVRKVSTYLQTERKNTERKKQVESPQRTPQFQVIAKKQSPRNLYVNRSPKNVQGNPDTSALQQFVDECLKEAGVSEARRAKIFKLVSIACGIGTVIAPAISALITYYSSSSGQCAPCPSPTPAPL